MEESNTYKMPNARGAASYLLLLLLQRSLLGVPQQPLLALRLFLFGIAGLREVVIGLGDVPLRLREAKHHKFISLFSNYCR
jgi:hypothetical protein